MKTTRSLLTLGFVSGFVFAVTGSAMAQATEITADNLTIQQSMSLGLINSAGPQSQAQQFPGMRILTTQSSSWQTFSSVIPGYEYQDMVVVEEYGYIDEGYWVDEYQEQQIGTQEYPEVVDETGTVITQAYSEPIYGPVLVGQNWVSTGSHWGVVGTREEMQTMTAPETYEYYQELSADAPTVEFQASRSDTNWKWTVPDNQFGQRPILTLWDGGLKLGGDGGTSNMALGQSALSYYRNWDANDKHHNSYFNSSSDQAEQTHSIFESIGGSWKQTLITSTLGDGINLKYQESVPGSTTTTQTQINARSAAFGGVVEVAGDLKVQGTLRVPMRGDISMGEFTNGPQP